MWPWNTIIIWSDPFHLYCLAMSVCSSVHYLGLEEKQSLVDLSVNPGWINPRLIILGGTILIGNQGIWLRVTSHQQLKHRQPCRSDGHGTPLHKLLHCYPWPKISASPQAFPLRSSFLFAGRSMKWYLPVIKRSWWRYTCVCVCVGDPAQAVNHQQWLTSDPARWWFTITS